MRVFCNSGQGAAEHRLISALASFDDDDDDDDDDDEWLYLPVVYRCA